MIDTEQEKAAISQFVIDLAIRLALLAGVTYASLLLLRPIAGMLLWSVILAVAAYPLFAALQRLLRLGSGLTAALLSTVLLVVLLAPVVLLADSAVVSLDDYARLLMRGEPILPPPPESMREWPMVGARLYDFWMNATNDLRTLLRTHVGQVASLGRWVGGIAAGVAFEVLQFVVAIVISGVLLAYADRLGATAGQIAGRITRSRGRHFLEITASTIRNVSQGVIGVALLQSALLGVGMLVAGIPFAGALTFVALVLAIVQIGPNIVMIPVIIWAWFSLPLGWAALFTAYTAPLLLLDNVLRPILMARGLRTPMAIILAGVVCGTLTGGLIGLFVGPVVLAVFYDLVTAWAASRLPEAPEALGEGAPTSGSP